MIGLSNGPGLTPPKLLFLGEKIFRVLEIFLLKNSSPFFSELVRVRTSKFDTLLMGIIKPYNFYYWHFLLRLLVSEIFAGPFHQAKAASSSFTVLGSLLREGLLSTPLHPNFVNYLTQREHERINAAH